MIPCSPGLQCDYIDRHISDTKQIFTLVDSEGNDVVEEEQLGLLLYRGGKVLSGYYFDFKAADAICRQMNFTHAVIWTTEENFDIRSNYKVYLRDVMCESEKWESCIFYETGTRGQVVYLSCTGKQLDSR